MCASCWCKSPCPHPGDVRPPGQGCHRASRPPVTTQGVLFDLLSCRKERWQTPPDRGEWFASIDLKDAYFHVPIAPHHRQFLQFAFQGHHFHFRVLPFGLSLPPRVFTRCVTAAFSPLQLRGMKILPGRLAGLCAISTSGDPGHSDSPLACGPAQSQSECPKELPGSLTEYTLSGGDSGCYCHEGLSITSVCG